jgi:hypothetical protein
MKIASRDWILNDWRLQARADASSLALRANNDCPTYEGMLKVETHGEQRVRQLLYRQVFPFL